MKKLIIILLMFAFAAPVAAENFPFAPKAKYGKHKTKKNKRVRKGVFQYCQFKKLKK